MTTTEQDYDTLMDEYLALLEKHKRAKRVLADRMTTAEGTAGPCPEVTLVIGEAYRKMLWGLFQEMFA